ncbi:MAG: aminoacyl-tRNA hydrolase [Thiotrichales bacterium]|nr:aminoacyl-tRNA hydrolase [Thiotrichales bacterium]
MSSPFQLIAGLGNPGPDYSSTRHNAGYWCIDRLADGHRCTFKADKRFSADVARLSLGASDYWLIKPTSYMNDSGRSVQAMLAYYKLDIKRTLVIHDEIDLPPGIIRLKNGGGHGGHNGVRDIIQATGSNAFSRIRIGVGHPGNKEQVVASVLGRASRAEQELIDQAIADVLQHMPDILQGRLQKAMTALHTKETTDSGNDG